MKMRWACGTYVGEVHTGVWWGNLRERNHLEDPGVDERIVLRRIFKEWGAETWIGSSLIRIGTGSVHL